MRIEETCSLERFINLFILISNQNLSDLVYLPHVIDEEIEVQKGEEPSLGLDRVRILLQESTSVDLPLVNIYVPEFLNLLFHYIALLPK